MTGELQEYLEQEYKDFEALYLHGRRFWRVPISALKDIALLSFFEQFCELFSDHPSEYNTLFYLVENSSSGYSVLFVCTHFEHAGLTDVRDLMNFLERHAPLFVQDGLVERVSLELLDNYGEKLHIRFYEAVPRIIDLLKQHSTRTVV